jgi:hypothetical protein
VANDFAESGAPPLRPQKTKPKPFHEGKTENILRPPVGRGRGLRLSVRLWKSLAQTGYERVKLTHVLGAARWPVLKWPPMAGFQVAAEERLTEPAASESADFSTTQRFLRRLLTSPLSRVFGF